MTTSRICSMDEVPNPVSYGFATASLDVTVHSVVIGEPQTCTLIEMGVYST